MLSLSIYKMPVKIRKKLDNIRCQFLWQGTSIKKRFALVNWKKNCMPKNLGGLGVLDLHCMNISLLLKWWWKLKEPHYNAIWKQVICAKYRDNTPLSKISPLWKDIIVLTQLGQTGRAAILGDGRDIFFFGKIDGIVSVH
jgi:hypothetical protein